MKPLAICIAGLCLFITLQTMANSPDPNLFTDTKKKPLVLIETSHGPMVIKLFPDKAPLTCSNFLSYVKDDYYSDTIFHKVIDGFILQGGGFNTNYSAKKHKKPILNESRQGLKNTKGSIAMALTSSKNSAASQFFINLADNPDLDYSTKKGKGYTVFGQVIEGYKTIETIRRIRTRKISIYSDKYQRDIDLHYTPIEKVVIKKMSILREKPI